jgi:uncharacterized membrane-anchored protein YhcB (DUF1043 family)
MDSSVSIIIGIAIGIILGKLIVNFSNRMEKRKIERNARKTITSQKNDYCLEGKSFDLLKEIEKDNKKIENNPTLLSKLFRRKQKCPEEDPKKIKIKSQKKKK